MYLSANVSGTHCSYFIFTSISFMNVEWRWIDDFIIWSSEKYFLIEI